MAKPKQDLAWAIAQAHRTLATSPSLALIYKKATAWGTGRQTIFALVNSSMAPTDCVIFVGPSAPGQDHSVWQTDVTMEQLATIPKNTKNRRLINLYVGHYLKTIASEPVTITAEDLTTALSNNQGMMGVNRRLMNIDADNLKSTASTSVHAENVSLTVHQIHGAQKLDDRVFVIMDATYLYDISYRGTSEHYDGPVGAKHRFVVLIEDQQLRLHRPVLPKSVSFLAHPMADIMGCIYGPCVIRNKWKSQHFCDL